MKEGELVFLVLCASFGATPVVAKCNPLKEELVLLDPSQVCQESMQSEEEHGVDCLVEFA